MFCKGLNFPPQIEIRFFFSPDRYFYPAFLTANKSPNISILWEKKVKKYSEDNSDLSSIKYFCVLIKGFSI